MPIGYSDLLLLIASRTFLIATGRNQKDGGLDAAETQSLARSWHDRRRSKITEMRHPEPGRVFQAITDHPIEANMSDSNRS